MIASSLARETIRTVSAIVRLLEQESALLNAMKPQEITRMQEQKAVLASEYEARLAGLRGLPELATTLAPALRVELAGAVDALKAAIADNQRALAAAQMATDQLVQSIVSAVIEEQRVQEHYRADGRTAPRNAAAAPVAVSVNQVL